jgi:iron complex outermembrane receptor protein
MHLFYLPLCLVIALFPISSVSAKDMMEPVIVTAKKIRVQDTKATYASEVYYREDIEKSNARTVIDFLNQNTSIVIMSNSGNRSEPKIDMRGFGVTEGYKSLVITLNGRRLNNIDSTPQAL